MSEQCTEPHQVLDELWRQIKGDAGPLKISKHCVLLVEDSLADLKNESIRHFHHFWSRGADAGVAMARAEAHFLRSIRLLISKHMLPSKPAEATDEGELQ